MSADLLVKPRVRPGFLSERHYTFRFAGEYIDLEGDPRSSAVTAIVKRICWHESLVRRSEPDTPVHFYAIERFGP